MCNKIKYMNLKRFIIPLGLMLFLGNIQAQSNQDATPLTTVSLTECYDWARLNYPLIAKLDLLEKSTQYSLSNAAKGNLPQININGQATYQSEVTELPIDLPNLEVPTISKDQYKVYAEVYQPLTHFSAVNAQKQQLTINGQIEQQKVEIDLYPLKDRINQIYFGILLMEVKKEQLSLAETDIDSTLARLEAAIQNGTATLMDKQLLAVEKININQQLYENESNKEAFLQMLSALTGKIIHSTTTFTRPEVILPNVIVNRPELNLLSLQEQLVDAQVSQLRTRNIPTLGLFVQGGMGRPALNFLSNDFAPYYIAGLKFNWNLSNRYTTKNDRQKFAIQRQLINNQRETFLLNTGITQSQQFLAVTKYKELLSSDQQVVNLREEIKKTAEVQLVNGLITTIDYIKIINDASRAKQQLELHEIMLLQAQYNLKTTTGN